MSQMDLGAMLRKAQEVQQRISDVQRDLGRRTVEGQAGAGMVTVVATADLRVKEIRIEKELLAGGDQAMLQDLVAAAVNAALDRARQVAQEELQKAAGGAPLGFGVPNAGPGGPAGQGGSGG